MALLERVQNHALSFMSAIDGLGQWDWSIDLPTFQVPNFPSY